MTTREEFEALLGDIIYDGSRNRGYDGALDAYGKALERIAGLEAEVRLLRNRNAELAGQRLELDERAYYDGHVRELEAALSALLDAHPYEDGRGVTLAREALGR